MSKKDLPNLKDVSRIPEELQPVVEWWQTKGPRTVGYVGAIILVVVAAFFWWESAEKKEASAVTTYLALPSETGALEEGELSRDTQLTQIIEAGAAIAPALLLERAHSRYNAAEYDAALADYDEAIKTVDDPALKDIALVGHIMAQEACQHYDEALAEIAAIEATFAQAATPHFLANEVTLAKARILTAKGDKEAGKRALEALLASTDEAVKANAEQTLAIIEAYGVTPPAAPAPVAETPAPTTEAPAPATEAPAEETPAPAPAPTPEQQ